MPAMSSPSSNPVADLLARHAAPDLVGGVVLPSASARPIVAEYGVGKPGSGRLTGAMVPLIIGGVLIVVSAIFAINAVIAGSVNMNSGMAIVLPLVIAAFIAVPALFKTKEGVLQWRRVAEIHAGKVIVADTAGDQTAAWIAPISNYHDVHQSFMFLGSGTGEGDGQEFEVVLLRHPDPAKTIYVSGTRKQTMGGMSFRDMVQAGKEGRKEDVMAATGDTRNPAVEALVAALVDETGLPLVQSFD